MRWLRLIVEKAPLLALSVGSCVITYIAQSRGGAIAVQHTTGLRLLVRTANAITSYVNYITEMFFPARLAVLYPFPRQQAIETVVASAAALLLITVVVLIWARRLRHLPVGWFWYLGTLVPVIGIVGVGEQARADRYTYFPLIGLFIMIVWSIPAPRSTAARIGTGSIAAAALLALSVQAWRQISVWRDSQSLFTHALEIVGPHPTLYLHYGVALEIQDDFDKAAEMYRAALALQPRYPQALNNLGLLAARDERLDEAADHYQRALSIHPRSAGTLNNLGLVLARQQKLDEALDCFRRALEIDPASALSFYNLGTTLMEHGRLVEAEQALREALRLRRDYPEARYNLELILSARNKPR